MATAALTGVRFLIGVTTPLSSLSVRGFAFFSLKRQAPPTASLPVSGTKAIEDIEHGARNVNLSSLMEDAGYSSCSISKA